MGKIALVTGITGQDGSYLAELLLHKGYEVHGIVRRSSSLNTSRIDHIFDRLRLHYGDMTDGTSITRILSLVRPDEIYALGAQSHVMVSFENPEYTAQVDAVGTLRLLEAIRILGIHPKVYQASTSEMFGIAPSPQNEETPLLPVSPYGAAKVYAYHITRTYRQGYGMFISNGILFNHESSRRGVTFVTRKITRGLAAIKRGEQKELVLGNLDALRDWGHARDFVEAMWLMLQREKPDDYVIGTGEQHSVREFVEEAGKCLGFSNVWDFVRSDSRYMRPAEVPDLCADYLKARRELGWSPRTTFKELVREMCEADMERKS